jgi:hypothetical protein
MEYNLLTKSKISLIGEKLKVAGIVVGIVISIITAISSYFKEEKLAKSSYVQLSSQIKALSEEQAILHKDISNLQGFILEKVKRDNEQIEALNNKEAIDKTLNDKVIVKRVTKKIEKSPMPEPVSAPPAMAEPVPVEALAH